MPSTTIVAGGGASGALFASALVHCSSDARVVVLEPREKIGMGMAYSTDCPAHLLNVPAAKMSAFPEDPAHFIRWLNAQHPQRFLSDSFVPRGIYGEYLHAVTRQARELAGERFIHVRSAATQADVTSAGVRVLCEDGSVVNGTSLVVACGNSLPAPWPGVSEAAFEGMYFKSAWEEGALSPASPDETVLLLGTGLTAVDAVLGLRHNGHRGTIYMVSRRGLLPHEHRVFDSPQPGLGVTENATDLLEAARALTRSAKTSPQTWRATLDGVRSKTNALWNALGTPGQRRFMRHVLPYWNVHRHRMAPEIVRAIAELMSSGALRMVAGRTGPITPERDILTVPVQLRGCDETLLVRARRVINCSGPVNDFRKLRNGLIQSLLTRGIMVPSSLGIGVQVAADGAPITAAGIASDRVFTLGPVRFGALIETTAIPEIRVQAVELAQRIANEFAAA